MLMTSCWKSALCGCPSLFFFGPRRSVRTISMVISWTRMARVAALRGTARPHHFEQSLTGCGCWFKAAGFRFRAIKSNIVPCSGMTGRHVEDTGAVGLGSLPDQSVTVGLTRFVQFCRQLSRPLRARPRLTLQPNDTVCPIKC